MSDISKEFGRRVAVLRKAQDITLDRLAELSGVSRSMLSQIERGQANPTLAVAAKIAEGFGLSIAHLVEGGGSTPLIEIVSADNQQALFGDRNGCRLRTLSPLHMEKDIEFYELTFARGGVLESDAHFTGTREILTVSAGSVELMISGEQSVRLNPGDTAHYPADRQHVIKNDSGGECICYLVVTYA